MHPKMLVRRFNPFLLLFFFTFTSCSVLAGDVPFESEPAGDDGRLPAMGKSRLSITRLRFAYAIMMRYSSMSFMFSVSESESWSVLQVRSLWFERGSWICTSPFAMLVYWKVEETQRKKTKASGEKNSVSRTETYLRCVGLLWSCLLTSVRSIN